MGDDKQKQKPSDEPEPPDDIAAAAFSANARNIAGAGAAGAGGDAVARAAVAAAAMPASDRVLFNTTIVLAVLLAVGLPLSLILLNLIFTTNPTVTIHVLWRFEWTLPVISIQLVSMSMLAGIWGATGGIISSILVEEKNARRASRSRMAWLVRPMRGAFVATVIFMMIQGGLLASTNEAAAGSPLEINARSLYFVLAIAAMAGFKEEVFLEKVSQIVLAVLGSPPQSDDDETPDASGKRPKGGAGQGGTAPQGNS